MNVSSAVVWLIALRVFVVLLSVFLSACGTPTAPTAARNVDGTPHVAGAPLQPWISTDVQTGDFHLQTP